MISHNDPWAYLFLGILIGGSIYAAIRLGMMIYYKFKFEYQYLQHPHLIEYSEEGLCLEPHAWVDTALAVRDLPVGRYKLCSNCGMIMGNKEKMASEHLLKQVREAKAIFEAKQKEQEESAARIAQIHSGYIDLYLRRNFAEELNDPEFAKKLTSLAHYSLEALEAATQKAEAELGGDGEDAGTPWGPMKGNA